MDLRGTRRRDEETRRAERARARLGALRPARGWVPKVPAAAGELAMLGVHAERMDVAPRADPEVDDDTGADRSVDEIEEDRTVRSGGSNPPGRYRAGRAVADRLPLPLRALAESLPSGVRGGEAGLQRMHAVVIGVLILVGLGVAVVSAGLGRPDVTPVDPAPSSTTLETGTPLPINVDGEAGKAREDRADGSSGGPAQESAERARGKVVVHVAGKVARPGIVELPAGSRVVDAVEAAGGADDGVDLSALNLARVLADGEQVAVGVEPAAQPRPTGDTAEPMVNINTATPAELETLPGIGPALAANITAWRDEHGRFTVIEELQEVSGIGPATLAELADRVTL